MIMEATNSDTKKGAGLSREEHATLNVLFTLPETEVTAILAEMRMKYQSNVQASAEIDKYDWNSPYRQRLQEVIGAGNAGDFDKMNVLKEQLKRDFPDHT